MTSYKLPGGVEVERVFDLTAGWNDTPDQPYVSVKACTVSSLTNSVTIYSEAWSLASF